MSFYKCVGVWVSTTDHTQINLSKGSSVRIQIRLQMSLLFVSDEKSYTGLIVAVSVAVGVVFIVFLLAIVIKRKYWYVHI